MLTIHTDEKIIDLASHPNIRVVLLCSWKHVLLKNVRYKDLIEVICEEGSYELEWEEAEQQF